MPLLAVNYFSLYALLKALLINSACSNASYLFMVVILSLTSKEEYKEGDVFISEYNSTYILIYVHKSSFHGLYNKGGDCHKYYMGGYTFMNGFSCTQGMYYTIEEALKYNKDFRKVGHLDVSALQMEEEARGKAAN